MVQALRAYTKVYSYIYALDNNYRLLSVDVQRTTTLSDGDRFSILRDGWRLTLPSDGMSALLAAGRIGGVSFSLNLA